MNQQNKYFDYNNLVVRYSLEYLSCNHAECNSCKIGKAHGPYWYGSFSLNKEVKRVFLGKSFKPLDVKKVIKSDIFQNRNAEQSKSENHTINANRSHNRIDRIDIKRIKAFKKKQTNTVSPLPTKKDFDRDLILLRGAAQFKTLKQLYRNMIKKYHPDKHPNHPQLNHWMAEINGEYRQKVKETA